MDAGVRTRRNAYAALTLDRAVARRDDDRWLRDAERDPAARHLILDPDGCVLATADGSAPCWLPAAALDATPAPATFLGIAAGRPYFARTLDPAAAQALAGAHGAQAQGLRDAGMRFDAFSAGLFAYARALSHWQAVTRHCSACGAPLTLRAAGHRAECGNPGCARPYFPRTDPAVIVSVEHADACLLGRKPNWPAGRFSTLAGFVEAGESLEDAVRREIAEEAGVEVIACDYHSSQPWPFPASLMLGFSARTADRRITLGDGELAEARWFTADQISTGLAQGSLVLSPPLSVAYRLIEDWLQRSAGLALDALVARAPR